MSYPLINRDGIDFTSDSEVCNLGYAEGELSDGRPYRMESFYSYGIETLTIFISIEGLEEKSMNDIKKMIVKEGLVDIMRDNVLIDETTDEDENEFLAINIPLVDHDEEMNKCLIKLKDFDI